MWLEFRIFRLLLLGGRLLKRRHSLALVVYLLTCGLLGRIETWNLGAKVVHRRLLLIVVVHIKF